MTAADSNPVREAASFITHHLNLAREPMPMNQDLPKCPHGNIAVISQTHAGDGWRVHTGSNTACMCLVYAPDEATARRAWGVLCGAVAADSSIEGMVERAFPCTCVKSFGPNPVCPGCAVRPQAAALVREATEAVRAESERVAALIRSAYRTLQANNLGAVHEAMGDLDEALHPPREETR